jgi:type I restriction enzyme, S subunit
MKPGWRRVRFGDVVRLSTERVPDPAAAGIDRYVGLEHLEPGDLRVRRWGLVADGTTFTTRFRPGQVLFGKRRAYQRKVAAADFEAVCSGDIYVLEPSGDELLPELLPFVCQSNSFFEHAVGTSAGSLSPRTKWESLTSYEFALPSLDEQRRAAAALIAADAMSEELRVLAASIECIGHARLNEATQHPSSMRRLLGDVAAIRNGSTPSRAQVEYWSGDIPWLPTGKVNDRIIDRADEFITRRALNECPLSVVPHGATLIAMIGEGQTRGRAAMLEIDACINQNFGAVIPTVNVDAWFLFYYLERQYEALRCWSQGTNQQALSCGLLKQFPITLPALEVQREATLELRELDQALKATINRQSEHAQVRAALLEALLN